PLIVEDGCLYTERSRYLEVRVAKRLAARLAASRTATAAARSSSKTTSGDPLSRTASGDPSRTTANDDPPSNVISLFRAPAAVTPPTWRPSPDQIREVM